MTSDYEDPASLPSCYGSMNSSRITYKAAQVRRPHPYHTTRSSRLSRTSIKQGKSLNIYFAFVLFVSSVNMAMLCYITITLESRVPSSDKQSIRPLPKTDSTSCPEMDQVVSSINTMMNALTYTLPQVLTSNKHSLITRMNHLVTEIKDFVKMNNLDLNVRLGLNRTIALRTGNSSKKDEVTAGASPRATKPPWSPPITLIPPKPTNRLAFYPLRSSDNQASDESIYQKVKALNTHHNPKNGDIESDINNLNPVF
uniref:Transmembrane protein n=1 Tax=Paramyxoviridae sp. TaxID=1663356 RepID=A0A858HS70_9MONO|nr:transmembrane protein [Paramyxoviridae sp.]